MNIGYLLIIILAILPLLYKFSFWLYVIQLKEYRLDRFKEYIRTKQGKNALFNFWFFIELPILFFSLSIFIDPIIYKLLLPILIYFLVFQNIFVLGKIFRKKFIKPDFSLRMLVLILFLLVDFIFCSYFILFYYQNFIYLFIVSSLTFSYVIIFIWIFILYPLTHYKKNNLINMAIKRSKKIKNVIKIGITGSYGKTSIKEFLSSILENEGKLLKTPKNINTELGVSKLIINKLNKKYDYFIAEMGAYKIGEIEDLGNIVNHKYGFLTAIGNQHLGLFGSIENTKQAKSEIAEKVLKNKGTLYINWDDKNIRSIDFPKKLNIVKYSIKKSSSNIKSEIIGFENLLTEFKVNYKEKEYIFKTNLIGKHNILNITGIIGFCLDLGIKEENLKKYLLNIKSPKDTLKIKYKKYKVKNKEIDLILINDTYNLSEQGLIAGLKVLKFFEGEKVLVLDDILELGKETSFIHFNLGKVIAKKSYIDKLLYIGINNKTDFIKGLAAGGFDKKNILTDLEDIKKKSIILFEGRGTKKYLDKF